MVHRGRDGARISRAQPTRSEAVLSLQSQLSISITDGIAIDSEFACSWCWPDTTDPFGLSAVNHSNTGVTFTGCQSEVSGFVFHSNSPGGGAETRLARSAAGRG